MTPREKFVMALEGKQPPGRVPHFELVFYLTMEALGKVHPSHRSFGQWGQMSERERRLQRRDIASVYAETARKYEHAGILFHQPSGWRHDFDEETMRCLDEIRDLSGMEYLLTIHGDATFGIPGGSGMAEMAYRMVDDPQGMKDEAAQQVDDALACGEKYKKHGALDGFCLCSDYCFNTGPFMTPAQFDEFVTPYLARLCEGYRKQGFYTIKHTDGNIMPILDALVSARPHALHSLDPQGAWTWRRSSDGSARRCA